jgi:hypothetical protein
MMILDQVPRPMLSPMAAHQNPRTIHDQTNG